MLGFIITFLKTYFHVYILLDKIALWVGYMGKIMDKKKELWDKKHWHIVAKTFFKK
jgi:hypothetical protein